MLGLGMSDFTIDTKYNSPLYSLTTDQDIDGDQYLREYSDLSLSQQAEGCSFTMEMAYRNKLRLFRHFSLQGDIGMNFMMFSSMKIENVEGQANVSGRYEQYGNVVLDEEWGYNGFGNVNLGAACRNNDVRANGFVPVSFVRLGVEFSIFERLRECRFSLGSTYQYALRDLVKSTVSQDNITMDNSIVYNTIGNDGMSSENVRNLAGLCNRSRIKGFMLNIGVAIMF